LASEVDQKILDYNKVRLTFPILAKKGKTWQYYNRQGQPLPLKVKKAVGFYREE